VISGAAGRELTAEDAERRDGFQAAHWGGGLPHCSLRPRRGRRGRGGRIPSSGRERAGSMRSTSEIVSKSDKWELSSLFH
jgi:hypothetical protein